MEFVTLADMKTYLRITDPAKDAEVTQTIQHASEAIWDYLNPSVRRPPTPWDATTAPALIQRQVMALTAAYWRHRGDDEAPESWLETLWARIRVELVRWRDPAVA
jgi:Phage gp6-like head-tail connector protein